MKVTYRLRRVRQRTPYVIYHAVMTLFWAAAIFGGIALLVALADTVRTVRGK